MAKPKSLAKEKDRSRTRKMKCIELPEPNGMAWLIYDWPVDEHALPAEKLVPDLAKPMIDVLIKGVPYKREGAASWCPGGLLIPPRPRYPKIWLYGCSDAVGKEEMNVLLRRGRALVARQLFWPNPRQGKAELSLWKRTKPMTMRAQSSKHRQWRFTNRTEIGRAKNRGVIVWCPGIDPKPWTIAEQEKQAKQKARMVYKTAIKHIEANPAKFGTNTQTKMAVCLLKRMTKDNVYDLYYDFDGITYYIENGMYETHGIAPGTIGGPFDDGTGKPILDKEGEPLKDPVRQAEDGLIAKIRCARGYDDVAKQAVYMVTEINRGVHHRYFSTKGLRSKSAMKMNDWIAAHQTQYKTSIYQCIKPNPSNP